MLLLVLMSVNNCFSDDSIRVSESRDERIHARECQQLLLECRWIKILVLKSVNNCFSDGSICAIESREERIRARIREEARDIRSIVTRRLKSLCRYFDPQRRL